MKLKSVRGRPFKTKHGHAGWKNHTRTYTVWASMRQRCCYEKNNQFYRYGGRGIRVCDRWMNSFENFLSDMGEVPDGHSIERINRDGNYEPSNCKWAARIEQANNKSNNFLIEAFGEIKTAANWARDARCVSNPNSLIRRIKKGICPEVAITKTGRAYARLLTGTSTQTLDK